MPNGISALYINGLVVLRVRDSKGDSLSELLPGQAVKLAQHLLSAAARSSMNHETLAQLTKTLPGLSTP